MYKLRTISKIISAVVLVAICVATFFGCSHTTNKTESIFALGTVITLVAQTDKQNFDNLLIKAKEVLSYAENLTADDGIVTRFNKAKYGETILLDEVVFSVLSKVQQDPLLDGYNPLMAPLVDLWGFSPRFKNGGETRPYDRVKSDGSYPLPKTEYINGFLSLTDISKIELFEKDGNYYCKKNIPSTTINGVEYNAELDLGGCIKGYCSDKIKALYEDFGIEYGYISFGSSSISLLKNKSGNWVLALTNPDDTQTTYYRTEISDRNASTSGDYENFYTVDGVRYCHIIGKDGYPVKNARSVTVIGASAEYCDMLSTAFMTLTKSELDKKSALLKEKGYDVVYTFGQPFSVVTTL